MAYLPYPQLTGEDIDDVIFHCSLCKNTLVYIIKRKLYGSLKIDFYFLVVNKNYYHSKKKTFISSRRRVLDNLIDVLVCGTRVYSTPSSLLY